MTRPPALINGALGNQIVRIDHSSYLCSGATSDMAIPHSHAQMLRRSQANCRMLPVGSRILLKSDTTCLDVHLVSFLQ